jgi:hypothetical protein
MALKINHFNKEVPPSLHLFLSPVTSLPTPLQVRQVISKYSPLHAKRIQLEEHSVFVIETLWRSRWMTPGYRKRYHQMIVKELETKLHSPHGYWNLRTRRELAYYAKAKWRPHFVFENDCAQKIQRQFRFARVVWQWQAPQRAKYSLLASEAYREYMKSPLKRAIREELYRLSGHKYVSRKHALHKLIPSLRAQDRAHQVIWKAFKAYKFSKDLMKAIVRRKERELEACHSASLRIQTVWRMLPAKRKRLRLERQRGKLIEETIKIQRFIRKRNQTFRFTVKRLLVHQKRYRAELEEFLHFSLLFRWKRHLHKKEMKARIVVAVNTIMRHYRIWSATPSLLFSPLRYPSSIPLSSPLSSPLLSSPLSLSPLLSSIPLSSPLPLLLLPGPISVSLSLFVASTLCLLTSPSLSLPLSRRRHRQWVLYRNRMATRIQTLFRNYRINSLAGVTRRLLVARKAVGFSDMATDLLTSLLHGDPATSESTTTGAGGARGARAGGIGEGVSGTSCHYKSPGIRQNTPQFQQALDQHTIYCNRYFTSSDAVLLSAVLRHPLCRARRLILHTVNGTNPSFEFDLLPALACCHSLRLVAVLGGIYSISFLTKLNAVVQLENPLIQTLLIESIHSLKTHETTALLLSSSSLLLDFFNFSVPGIRNLTLHGLSLVGEDLRLLAKGLAVNSSLTHLSVSLNLIEEDGFLIVFSTLSSAPKSALISLDFSWNLVSLTDSVVRVLEEYHRPPLPLPLPGGGSGGRGALIVNLLHNRITVPYRPTREFRSDLIVKTVEDQQLSQQGQQRGGQGLRQGSQGQGKPWNTRGGGGGGDERKNKKSKFRSSLMRDLQRTSPSPLMSKTS